PTITPSTSNTLICNGSSATLSVVGASTYTWNPGNLNGTPIIVSPTTTTVYTVTGTTGLCTDTKTISVTVDNGPIVSVIGSPTTICSTSGNSATLTASGAINYTWNPGAIISSSIIITPTITTSYSVSGVNIFGCISTTTISFSVTPTPTLIPISSSTAICIGNSATLSATGANSYTWNPGALTGGTVIVTPIANTTYTVSGSNGNCVSSQTISIIVNSNPTLTSNSSPTLVCSGNSSTLTANGALTYTWSPGAISGQTINITPATTTNYTVTGTNATGCTASAVTSVSVNITPTINPIASPTAICRGNSATLTASGATNYTWLPGGFTSTSIVVSPTVNTTYTVIGNTGNCSSIKTVTLIVRPTPNINIITIPPVICNGGTSILLANGALSYTWSPGSSFSNTMIVSPSVTTSYTVTGTNIFGCRNTAVTTVTVNPTPTITTLASSTMACLGASVNLTSSGALNYILNPGAQTGSLIVVTPTVTTTYTITGVNIFGCIGSNTVTINVGSNPTITANSSSTIACNGTSVSLTANGATNYTWMPVGVNGSSIITTATNSINTYTVIGEIGGCVGSSTLSVLVIDCSKVFGMTKAASKPVLINNSFYNVTFTITAVNASSLNLTNVSLNENLSVAFPYPSSFTVVNQPVVTSQNSSLSIHPLFDGVSEISLTSPTTSTLLANKRDTIIFTVKIDPKGFYGPFYNSVIGFADILNSITVSDSSNNGFAWDPDNDGDPTNNDTITVINLPIIDLFVPDGFTPDGDGKNDFFFIKGLNGRSVKLTIFNRWGNKVYEKTNYDNSWNGYVNTTAITLGADKVPAATYYYVIEFLDGDKETRTGFVV
ncbi:MAG: gliding motility-associated C-terminal domain-containing protein, partial [Rubrivivax sp.]|nr:gliding motility-associated C-terminal domain-containing protein [Rubrivivax sp.]